MHFFAVLSFLAAPAAAHIALWDDAMFGGEDGYEPVTPLTGRPFDQWWFHGFANKPPPEGKFMELPAGGSYQGRLSCGKESRGDKACVENPSAMHQGQGPRGTALAIAYMSDPNQAKPEDFTVISIDYNSPDSSTVDYKIPEGLAECPEGGCLCLWGWGPGIDSAQPEMYLLGYRCKVTGGGNKKPGKGQVPKLCKDNKGDCVKGPKQMMFWTNQGPINIPDDARNGENCYYNADWGFENGAQNDAFEGGSTSEGGGSSDKGDGKSEGDKPEGGEGKGDGENKGGENKGGENKGGENKGGENKGGENKGGENKGGENKGEGGEGGENKDGGEGKPDTNNFHAQDDAGSGEKDKGDKGGKNKKCRSRRRRRTVKILRDN